MDTKRVRKFVVAVLVIMFLVAGATQGNPALSQPIAANSAVNGHIAFSSDRDGNYEIYVMNTDGTGQTNLTNNPAEDVWPDWSPDGSKIVFTSNRDDGSYEAYTMNPDGTGVARLTSGPAWNRCSTWSPDGSKIAFISDRNYDTHYWDEIFVMSADGTGVARLTDLTNQGVSWFPDWSPGGDKIAFASNRDGNDEIYLMNADGTGQTRLTNNGVRDDSPAWSPDGSKIAFTVYGESSSEIYIMNADGSGQTNLTSNWVGGAANPAWSPDGSKIAFGNCQIYVMNADGTGQTRLTNGWGCEDWPDWGPGGGEAGTFLDLPVSYSNFAQSAQGNVGGKETGRVNAWIDHTAPTYATNCDVTVWSGKRFVGCQETRVDTCSTGVSCYDGHSGVDFQHQKDIVEEPVFAAAPGTVVEVCRNYPCDRDSSFGNYVLISHGNRYATLYAHLKSVNNGIDVGAAITVPQSQPIGVMGGTGGYPVHLHFGVYYDQNGDGKWADGEVVDPYGWAGSSADPWNPASVYLWKYPLWSKITAGSGGASLTSQSGMVNANVPAGALTSEVTLELWDAPVANPSASLRSVGHSFWLRVLEWLTGSGLRASSNIAIMGLSQPITLTVTYGITETRHLDTTQLVVYRWNGSGDNWLALPSTIDLGQRQVTAQTAEMGEFDLQAPLLCLADSTEPDDQYDSAPTLSTDGIQASRLFDISGDEDWFRFTATAGKTYELSTSSLGAGVDTIVELYDLDGVTLLVSDDNSGGGMTSRLEWQTPLTGTYFLRVIPASGSATGCDATYKLSIAEKSQLGGRIYLPIVLKNSQR